MVFNYLGIYQVTSSSFASTPDTQKQELGNLPNITSAYFNQDKLFMNLLCVKNNENLLKKYLDSLIEDLFL